MFFGGQAIDSCSRLAAATGSKLGAHRFGTRASRKRRSHTDQKRIIVALSQYGVGAIRVSTHQIITEHPTYTPRPGRIR